MLFRSFNGIPVALLAVNNPIAVIFTGIFMSMLNIVGLQLTNLTAYNEYITDVIIATIVYLSAFSLVIKMLIGGRKKHKATAETQTAHAQNTDAKNTEQARSALSAEDTVGDKTPEAAGTEEGGERV